MDVAGRTVKPDSDRVARMYRSSLLDLRTCSKSVIDNLTAIAREHFEHASILVRLIEEYLMEVQYDTQLPVLYLIDSLIKNITEPFTKLFSRNIVALYSHVFKASARDEKRVNALRKLRGTWTHFFPKEILYMDHIDVDTMIRKTEDEILWLQKMIDVQEKRRNSFAKKRLIDGSDLHGHCTKRSRLELDIEVNTDSSDVELNNNVVDTKSTKDSSAPVDVNHNQIMLTSNLLWGESSSASETNSKDQTDVSDCFSNSSIRLNTEDVPAKVLKAEEKPRHREKLMDELFNTEAVSIKELSFEKESKSRKQPMDELFDTKLLRTKNLSAIASLYKGQQCSSCDERFVCKETYKRHLDWHFQLNRKKKLDKKKINDVSDCFSNSPNRLNTEDVPAKVLKAEEKRRHREKLMDGLFNTEAVSIKELSAEKESKSRKQLIDELFDTKLLRTKNLSAIASLYKGHQCSSCDERFVCKETYKRHLDSHFQLNRKEKLDKKKIKSRSWFPKGNTWMEDSIPEIPKEMQNTVPKQCSVKDDGSRNCAICSDPFEEFFNGEEEEWQLKPAIRHNDENVHPMCLKEHLAGNRIA